MKHIYAIKYCSIHNTHTAICVDRIYDMKEMRFVSSSNKSAHVPQIYSKNLKNSMKDTHAEITHSTELLVGFNNILPNTTYMIMAERWNQSCRKLSGRKVRRSRFRDISRCFPLLGGHAARVR